MKVKHQLTVIGCLFVTLTMQLGCSSLAQEVQNSRSGSFVTGQLQLPEGNGARGMHVIIDIAKNGTTTRNWIELNHELKFRESFDGTLVELEVVTALSTIAHRFNTKELAQFTKQNAVDVGIIDLRTRLKPYKIKFSSVDSDTLRVGMWLEKPQTDSMGSLPSLGSRQFVEIEAGKDMDLLLPSEFETAYFLMEAPADNRRGRKWRSGKQKLFGPFRSSKVPSELKLQ